MRVSLVMVHGWPISMEMALTIKFSSRMMGISNYGSMVRQILQPSSIGIGLVPIKRIPSPLELGPNVINTVSQMYVLTPLSRQLLTFRRSTVMEKQTWSSLITTDLSKPGSIAVKTTMHYPVIGYGQKQDQSVDQLVMLMEFDLLMLRYAVRPHDEYKFVTILGRRKSRHDLA